MRICVEEVCKLRGQVNSRFRRVGVYEVRWEELFHMQKWFIVTSFSWLHLNKVTAQVPNEFKPPVHSTTSMHQTYIVFLLISWTPLVIKFIHPQHLFSISYQVLNCYPISLSHMVAKYMWDTSCLPQLTLSSYSVVPPNESRPFTNTSFTNIPLSVQRNCMTTTPYNSLAIKSLLCCSFWIQTFLWYLYLILCNYRMKVVT